MHTVIWFPVLLYNIHNLTSVTCLHRVCSIWPIDKTLSGATTPGQSGPGSNGIKRVLHIPQISKARASPSDVLLSYPGHLGVLLPLCRDAVGIFYSPSWLGWQCFGNLSFNSAVLVTFAKGCKGNKPHWTVRCWACLILSKYYLLDLPL